MKRCLVHPPHDETCAEYERAQAMTDIVERLRWTALHRVARGRPSNAPDVMREAAAEIERLQRHIEDLRELRKVDRAEIEQLRTALHEP
jgi:signal transduction histidine kinase